MIILRGTDRHGAGHFGAPRGDRVHNGVDLACSKGAKVCSPASGMVTKLGYPYAAPEKRHFRYVQVTDSAGFDHRIFYISPTVKVGDSVQIGEQIGIAQGLTELYPGIIDHVHYEVMHGKSYFNPHSWLS